jgi:HEAT repeat protein
MEAVHSAASLELHAAEERLRTLSRSPNADVRYESIVALGVLAPLSRLPEIIKGLEDSEQSQEVREAILVAKNNLKQRLMLGKGETIWDDNLILGEIEDMVDNSGDDNKE